MIKILKVSDYVHQTRGIKPGDLFPIDHLREGYENRKGYLISCANGKVTFIYMHECKRII